MPTHFCERCCEQAAGRPPRVDYRDTFIYAGVSLANFLMTWLFKLCQLLGWLLFFSVAIWFAPIAGPMTEKEKALAELKARRAAEEEEARKKEDEWRQKNDDAAARLNSMGNEFECDRSRISEDDRLVREFNDESRKVRDGLSDPEMAAIRQAQIAREAEQKRLAEIQRFHERNRLVQEALDIDHRRRRLRNERDNALASYELERAHVCTVEHNACVARLVEIEARLHLMSME